MVNLTVLNSHFFYKVQRIVVQDTAQTSEYCSQPQAYVHVHVEAHAYYSAIHLYLTDWSSKNERVN